jgi:glutathione-independent formaldehyde dehydrogenase
VQRSCDSAEAYISVLCGCFCCPYQVGFEACGIGSATTCSHDPESAINSCIKVTKCGGRIGVPGYYAQEDRLATDPDRRHGRYKTDWALFWNKAQAIAGGQCPVSDHNKDLLKAILYDRVDLAKALNVQILPLSEAPQAYERFNKGEAAKSVKGMRCVRVCDWCGVAR